MDVADSDFVVSETELEVETLSGKETARDSRGLESVGVMSGRSTLMLDLLELC